MDDAAIPDAGTTVLIFLTIAVGLVLDRLIPIWGQLIAGVMSWGFLIALYTRMEKTARLILLSGLFMAMFGEVFCSLIWELYDYRYFNIPPYVPPGHMLVFLLGASISRKMPKIITTVVPALAGLCVALSVYFGYDTISLVLFLFFIACLFAEKDMVAYSTMFMLCLVLEIAGTALGNWTWKETVPVWGISMASPPIGSGALYCVLDFCMYRIALAYWPIKARYIAFSYQFNGYIPEFLKINSNWNLDPARMHSISDETADLVNKD